MKKLIGTRWTLDYIYLHKEGERIWVFDHKYVPRKSTIVEFSEDGTLITYGDGEEELRLPYIYAEDILVIDSSSLKSNRCKFGNRKIYIVKKRLGGLLLCEFDEDIRAGTTYVIALGLEPD